MRGHKKLLLNIIGLLLVLNVCGQTIQPMGFKHYSFPFQVNIGYGEVKFTDSSAYLEIGKPTDSKKGVLIPRATTAQRNAFVFKSNGLLIYNVTTSRFNYWNGSSWIEINPTGGGGGGGGGISGAFADYGLLNLDDSTLRVDTFLVTTRLWRNKLRDSLVGLIGAISPAGNFGNLQLNRNGSFSAASSDSLNYTTSAGLVLKNYFESNIGGQNRLYSNSLSSGMFSPNGLNSVQVSDAVAQLNAGSSTNYVKTNTDSTRSPKRISYESNINGTFTTNSLVTKGYTDSIASAAVGGITIPNVGSAFELVKPRSGSSFPVKTISNGPGITYDSGANNLTPKIASFFRSNLSYNSGSAFIGQQVWRRITDNANLRYTDGAMLFQIGDTLLKVGGTNDGLSPVTTDSTHISLDGGATWTGWGLFPYAVANVTSIPAKYAGDWNYILGCTDLTSGNCRKVVRFKTTKTFEIVTSTAEYGIRKGFGAFKDDYGNLYIGGGQTSNVVGFNTGDIWMSTAQSGGKNWTQIQTGLSWLGGMTYNSWQSRDGFAYVLNAGTTSNSGGTNVYSVVCKKIPFESIINGESKWINLTRSPAELDSGIFGTTALFKGNIYFGFAGHGNPGVNGTTMVALDKNDKWHHVQMYEGVDTGSGVILGSRHAAPFLPVGDDRLIVGLGASDQDVFELIDSNIVQPFVVSQKLTINHALNLIEGSTGDGFIGLGVGRGSYSNTTSYIQRNTTDPHAYTLYDNENGEWWAGILNAANSTINTDVAAATGKMLYLKNDGNVFIYPSTTSLSNYFNFATNGFFDINHSANPGIKFRVNGNLKYQQYIDNGSLHFYNPDLSQDALVLDASNVATFDPYSGFTNADKTLELTRGYAQVPRLKITNPQAGDTSMQILMRSSSNSFVYTISKADLLAGFSGGSGVTSVATNNGSGITGGTITTTGTLAIDTSIIATKAYALSIAGGGGTPSLTQYQIGVGDGSNLLSGSSNFTFQNGTLTTNGTGGAHSIKIGGTETWRYDYDANYVYLTSDAADAGAGRVVWKISNVGELTIDPDGSVGSSTTTLNLKKGRAILSSAKIGNSSLNEAQLFFEDNTDASGQIYYDNKAMNILVDDGAGSPTSAAQLSASSVTINALAGTGNKIIQGNSSGVLSRTSIDPANILTSAGDLSPLFTTSESSNNISFSLSNAAAHTFFGNNTGSTGTPAYVSLTSADIPALDYWKITGTTTLTGTTTISTNNNAIKIWDASGIAVFGYDAATSATSSRLTLGDHVDTDPAAGDGGTTKFTITHKAAADGVTSNISSKVGNQDALIVDFDGTATYKVQVWSGSNFLWGTDTVATRAYARSVGGGGGGYTNLTQFVGQNNWKVFYSDGGGDVQELSLGAAGTFLGSNGTTSAPSFQNLANLTATDGTLTFSGTYNGSTARTIGINLANANTWTATQTINPGAAGDVLKFGVGGTDNGADIRVNTTGEGIRIFAGTTYTNAGGAFQMWGTASTFAGMYFDAGSASGNDIRFRNAINGTTKMSVIKGGSIQFEDYTDQKEIASPGTGASGYGRFWVSSTDSKPHFITDGGVDYDLTATGSGGITIGTTAITSGTDTKVLFDNAGVVGEYVISGSGNVAMTTSANLTTPKINQINDANANELFIFTSTASAVNELTYANAATGTNPLWTASGGDADVGIDWKPKAAGKFRLLATTSGPAELRFFEDADNGTNYAGVIAPASLGGDITITLPNASSTLPIFGQQITFSGPTTARTVTLPDASFSAARNDAGQTFTGTQTFSNAVINTNNAIAASGNAATVPVTAVLNTVTNNSAATLTITMATASAVDGQVTTVRILDATAATQTITWVNTENSSIAIPTTSNGSTTLFLTVRLMYNAATSKWRCIGYA